MSERHIHQITRLLTIKEVSEVVRLSISHIRRLVGDDKFPKPVKISERRTVWLVSDIEAFIQGRIVR
jgi:predicted DNA-binding transcriptional regulator AlpA